MAAEKRSFRIDSLLGRAGEDGVSERRPSPPPLPLLGATVGAHTFCPYPLSAAGLLPPAFQPAGPGAELKPGQVPLDWLAARASMFYPRYADFAGE